jgi:hypothetical protein
MKQGAKFCCGNILTNYLVKRLARKKQQELAEW